MADIRKGILIMFGVVIALVILAAVVVIAVRIDRAVRSSDAPDLNPKEALADCIAREYGISKDDFRMRAMLEEYTVCHAQRDGVNIDPVAPSGAPVELPSLPRPY